VKASTSCNPKGLHGLYRDKFSFILTNYKFVYFLDIEFLNPRVIFQAAGLKNPYLKYFDIHAGSQATQIIGRIRFDLKYG
jgi:hypothetical protein